MLGFGLGLRQTILDFLPRERRVTLLFDLPAFLFYEYPTSYQTPMIRPFVAPEINHMVHDQLRLTPLAFFAAHQKM